MSSIEANDGSVAAASCTCMTAIWVDKDARPVGQEIVRDPNCEVHSDDS